jgi:general secretion pathway protein G
MTTPPLDYAPVHARRRRIGLWVALALSVLLVAAGAWLYRAWEASKQVRAARLAAVAAQLAAIEAAVDAFEVDNGRFPTTAEGLGALVQPPPKLSGWSGPYVKRAVPADPWGTPYAYAASGGFYTVTSAGPDRRLGTPDDVATPAPLTTQPVRRRGRAARLPPERP